MTDPQVPGPRFAFIAATAGAVVAIGLAGGLGHDRGDGNIFRHGRRPGLAR